MKRELRLTTTHPSAQEMLTFDPATLVVMNYSPYAVLVRRGVAALPTRDSYDYIIPAGSSATFAVVGREFGFVLDFEVASPAVYSQPATIIFLSADETPPVFSTSVYREAVRIEDSGDNDYYIDTRGARAIYIEYVQNPPFPRPLNITRINYSSVHIIGVDRVGGAETVLYDMSNPYNTAVSRVILPLADNLIKIQVRRSANPYVLKYTLLDTIPAPVRQAIMYRHTWESDAWTVGVEQVILHDRLTGNLESLDIKLRLPTADDDYEFYLSVLTYNGTGGSTVFDVKLTNKMLIPVDDVQRGGRLSGYFIGRDDTVVRYAIPLGFRVSGTVVVRAITVEPLPEATIHIVTNLEI